MIFYEAPHKLTTTLADLVQTFGPDWPIALCRELTKLHEEVVRTTLAQALERYEQEPPRGEFVLVVAGAQPQAAQTSDPEDALAQVAALRAQGLSLKDAVKQVSKALELPRNQLYALALEAEK